MFVDTHCHLNFDSFDADREAVLERAHEGGLVRILNPGVDLATSREAVSLAEASPIVFAAVGVHPNDARSWKEGTLAELREMTQHPKVVAVGEIGIDYYRKNSPHDLQQLVFRQQLELAGEVGLPVVVHIRNASEDDRRAMMDTLGILKEWQSDLQGCASPLAERPGDLHSFSGGLEAALEAAKLNFCIGISGPITFKNAAMLQEVAAKLSLEHILIETDAPFLTPHPHSGERNEPAYVRHVAEKIAQIRQLTLDSVGKVTTANAERLFLWQASP
jgi:TatD DNase family protein